MLACAGARPQCACRCRQGALRGAPCLLPAARTAPRPAPTHRSYTDKECDPQLFSGCHPEHRVCKPNKDALDAAMAASTAADSAGSSGGKGGDGKGKGDQEAAAGEFKPGSQVVGERCGASSDCAAPLYCGEVKELGRKACLEKVR